MCILLDGRGNQEEIEEGLKTVLHSALQVCFKISV